MSTRIRSAASRAARDLAYLAIGLVTSIVAMTVWITGVSVSASLAVFIVGIPVFVASAVAFRWTAELDRRNAALVLGHPIAGRYRGRGGRGWLDRLAATTSDPQTWRDLAWLVLHSAVGFGFGVAAVTGVATVIGLAGLPLWYQTLPEGANVGLWEIDTLNGAVAATPLALPAAALTVGLLRLMALGEAHLAAALLGPPAQRRELGAGLGAHAAVAVFLGSICALVWQLTSDGGYFWPVWVWLGFAITVALHTVAIRAAGADGDAGLIFRGRVELCAVIALVCVAVWALAGGGYFWPVWPALGMATGLGLRALYVFRHRLPWLRERALVARVDELTRTRRGALDVQAAELRRIERDLHDGAQARLVSLSMLVGRAEERLGDRPEVAELVREAREEAGAAIRELRDLARGIAPPVLADRGLTAAIESLATRSPMEVTVEASKGRRPPPVVETAAYFVVAEALTNVAKHGGGAPAHVTIGRRAGLLVVEVADQGPGGADPAGSGLTGLRHRVEALDGTLRVQSPALDGTRIRAELPCA